VTEDLDSLPLSAFSPLAHKREWSLSKNVMEEIHLSSLLMMGGPQEAQILQSYEKNVKSVRRGRLFQSILLAIVISFLTVLPISGIAIAIDTELTDENTITILYALATTFAGYYLMLFGMFMILVLIDTSIFIKGDSFRYLITLPLSRFEIGWVALFTFLRMYLIPIVFMVFALPVAGGYMTGSLRFIVISLISNGIFAIFTISALIIVANVMAHRVFKTTRSKGAAVFRVLVTLGYMILVMSIFIFMQEFLDLVTNLFSEDPTRIQGQGLLALLAIIPFPFAPAFLDALTLFPGMMSIRIASIFGLVFFGGITFIMALKAGSIFIRIPFRSTYDLNIKDRPIHETPSEFGLVVNQPVDAFTKSSLVMVTRDMGRLTLIILPMLLPLMVGAMSSSTSEAYPIVGLSYVIGYLGMMPAMINMAFSSAEERVGGTIASLPYRVWDQVRARRRLMVGFMLVPLTIMLTIVSFGGTLDAPQMMYFLSVIPFIVFLATIYLLLFAFLFGKVNRNYTLYEVNIQWRGPKISALIIIPMILVVVVYIGFIIYILITDAAEMPAVAVLWVFVIFLVVTSEIAARKVFKGPTLMDSIGSLST